MIVLAKRVIIGACLICGVLALAYMVSSAITPVRCRAALSRSNAEVGDSVRYSVNAVAGRGIDVSIPEMEKYLEKFDIVDKGMYVSRFMGKTRSAKWYRLIQYKPGSYTIPSVAISFKDPDGSQGNVETGPVSLEVRSVLKDEEKAASGITFSGELGGRAGPGVVRTPGSKIDDAPVRLSIADVKAPLDLLTLIDIGVMAGSGVIFIAVFLFIASIVKKARVRMAYVSPYESALAQLKKVRANEALDDVGVKEFYSKLSRILSAYIGLFLGTGTVERTTGDLLASIGSCEKFDGAFKDDARALFLLCDLVKYSGFKPDKQAIEASLETTKKLVEAVHKNEETKEIKK